jgi:hypothetical protein
MRVPPPRYQQVARALRRVDPIELGEIRIELGD